MKTGYTARLVPHQALYANEEEDYFLVKENQWTMNNEQLMPLVGTKSAMK